MFLAPSPIGPTSLAPNTAAIERMPIALVIASKPCVRNSLVAQRFNQLNAVDLKQLRAAYDRESPPFAPSARGPARITFIARR